MAKASKDRSGWDSVDEQAGFQEQIGSQRYEDHDASGTSMDDSAEDMAKISMPEESLPADDNVSFREQLSSEGDDAISGDMITDDEFAKAAQEQLEDDPE